MGKKSDLSRRDFLKGAAVTGVGAASAGILAGYTPAAASSIPPAKDGTFVGVGTGRNGAIVVSLDIADGIIAGLTVVDERETKNIGDTVINTYPELIVANNTHTVDVISGATITSMAFREAVRNALEAAGLDPAGFFNPTSLPAPASGDTSVDMVVIGSGGAGLFAAVKTAMAGKKVILLEKLGVLGGTSNHTCEGMGCTGSRVQLSAGYENTAEAQAQSQAERNPNITYEGFLAYTSRSGANIDWLRTIGAVFPVVSGAASVNTSREIGKIGTTIVGSLVAECKKQGVDIRTNSAATELIISDGKISGVKVKTNDGTEYTITTKTAVITCGGFGANNDMVTEQNKDLQPFRPACSTGCTGEAILAAEKVGAKLTFMDYIRVNFCYGINEKTGYHYYMGAVFNLGAVYIGLDGKRFINEQSGYGSGLQVVEKGGVGWAIFDSQLLDASEDVRQFKRLGMYVKADTLDELFDKIGIDKTVGKETIDTYVGYVKNGEDPEFHRGMLNMTFDEPPYYACKMTCMIQGTFGGIATNPKAEVLDASDNPIPGLYAAGECAEEGTWGANPASVNLSYGQIASDNAILYMA